MPSLLRVSLASIALAAGFTQLGHAASIPRSAEATDDISDPNYMMNMRQKNEEQAAMDWKEIQCDSDGVNDASVEEFVRWEMVKAEKAWSEVGSSWKDWKEKNPNRDFNFSRHVSNLFNGPEGMDCQNLIDDNGCHSGSNLQCHDTNHPAGYFILNSLRNFSGVLWNLHETLEKARNNIDGILGKFSDTFAPQKDKGLDVDIIMDIVLLGYGSVAAPMWTNLLKKWSWNDKKSGDFETLKDFTNALAGNGISLAKDVTTNSDTPLGTQNSIKERLTDIIRIWEDSVVDLAEKMFSGNDEDVEMLGKIIANGKMMASTTRVPSVKDLRESLEKAIYAILIPLAWDISDKDISPFILDTGMSCNDANGDWGQNEGKFLSGVKESHKICKDDRAYYLVAATGDCHGGSPFEDNDTNDCGAFPLLPGVDTLDGTAWGGITREDIVYGSLNTFDAHGSRNHEERMKWHEGISKDHLTGLGESIQEAYTFALPICDLKTAWDNFYHNENADRSKNNFPCKIDHDKDWKKKQDMPPPYDCKGSGMCGSAVNFVRNCDRAVNHELIRNDDINYGSADSDKEIDGARKDNCKIFIAGPASCTRTGNQMWDDYQDLKDPGKGSCGRCGSKHWGENNECRTTVNYVA